ncbi:MAG TPA: glycoside hydrolase family 3 C-terminal domain-containing protein [Steroidobacteraceae bacterium]|nr:glycoside hydrolase family 3 C-terminal domain-containing protein [Steroidobacteraceae bacterium]
MKSEQRRGRARPFHLLLIALSLGTLPTLAPLAAERAAAPDATDFRVDALLQQLTLPEKISLLAGDGTGMNLPALARIGLPSLHMMDGPQGTRLPSPSVAYPASIALAASFDTVLARQVGEQIGLDARARGAHFLLGPGLNLYRTPLNGRNFEYFGEDPWLASRMTVNYVQGVQAQGVSATLKHFAANNSEYARGSSESHIDERTLHEIYLPAFEAGVKEAHAGALMDAYNRLNGPFMTANAHLNDEIARQQWGFDGIVMSDWGATHDTLPALLGGLDVEMPDGANFNAARILPLIQQGKVSTALIDEKVRRLLRLAVRFNWLGTEQRRIDVPRDNPEGRDVALREAEEGTVLLKNTNALLPLDATRVKTIAVIGPQAEAGAITGGGSGKVDGFASIGLVSALSDAVHPFGGRVLSLRAIPTLGHMALHTVIHIAAEPASRSAWLHETYTTDALTSPPGAGGVGAPVEGALPRFEYDDDGSSVVPEALDFAMPPGGAVGSIRDTGYYHADHAARYTLFLRNGAADRIFVDGQLLIDSWNYPPPALQQTSTQLTEGWHRIVIEQRAVPGDSLPGTASAPQFGAVAEDTVVDPAAERMAASADVVIVMLGFDSFIEGEGSDRGFELPPGQEPLVQALLAKNRNVVVMLTGGGSVDVSGFVDAVPAMLQGWYAGQEGATAFAHLLFGKANPSGHLPISWERRLSDNPSYASYYYDNPQSQRIDYRNGIFTGYRGFDRTGVKPLFPFGFGLSYTTFHYSGLKVDALAPPGSAQPYFDVSFDLRNTGTRAGADVAQLYLSDLQPAVPRPLKELKAFQRVYLEPGESRHVTLRLDARSFCYFDVKTQHWLAPRGVYGLQIARSAGEPELAGTLQLSAPLNLPP